MSTTRFIHLRGASLNLAHEYFNVMAVPQNGGATVAYVYHPNAAINSPAILVQIARCSNKDHYCKRIGRATAMLSTESFWIPLPFGFDPSPRNIYNVVLAWARSVIPAIKRGK